MSFHSTMSDEDVHALTAKTYADLSARNSDSAWQIAGNINKLVKITDINAYHVLVSVGPTVWLTMGLEDNLEVLAGTGMTGGAGGSFGSSVERVGGIVHTTIVVDLEGLNSKATDSDIIGVVGANPAHMGQITVARNGTIFMATMRCIEFPAGGDENIALWSVVESTGSEDDLVTDLDETLLLDSQGDGTDWAAGDVINIPVFPVANSYLYLAQGDATGTTATYTAGKFIIEFWGV